MGVGLETREDRGVGTPRTSPEGETLATGTGAGGSNTKKEREGLADMVWGVRLGLTVEKKVPLVLLVSLVLFVPPTLRLGTKLEGSRRELEAVGVSPILDRLGDGLTVPCRVLVGGGALPLGLGETALGKGPEDVAVAVGVDVVVPDSVLVEELVDVAVAEAEELDVEEDVLDDVAEEVAVPEELLVAVAVRDGELDAVLVAVGELEVVAVAVGLGSGKGE